MSKADFEGETLTKDSFSWDSELGEGSYSEVHLCTFKKNGKKFAVKKVFKQLVNKAKMMKSLMVEEKALNAMDHPFIVKLFAKWEDEEHKYFVLEYCKNGDFFKKLQKNGGKVSLDICRHYCAEMLCALKYMKDLKIVHRDIKPENVLLDENNRTKITDFGTAKLYKNRNKAGLEDLKTRTFSKNTFCGTAQYITPEILQDKPCSYTSDLWALGVCIFHYLSGKYPFTSPSPYMLFQQIQKRQLNFPSDLDPDAKDLIDKLLQVNPKDRLGYGKNGYSKLKAHPFWKGIDFKRIHKIQPPEMK